MNRRHTQEIVGEIDERLRQLKRHAEQAVPSYSRVVEIKIERLESERRWVSERTSVTA